MAARHLGARHSVWDARAVYRPLRSAQALGSRFGCDNSDLPASHSGCVLVLLFVAGRRFFIDMFAAGCEAQRGYHGRYPDMSVPVLQLRRGHAALLFGGGILLGHAGSLELCVLGLVLLPSGMQRWTRCRGSAV